MDGDFFRDTTLGILVQSKFPISTQEGRKRGGASMRAKGAIDAFSANDRFGWLASADKVTTNVMHASPRPVAFSCQSVLDRIDRIGSSDAHLRHQSSAPSSF